MWHGEAITYVPVSHIRGLADSGLLCLQPGSLLMRLEEQQI